MTKRSLLILSLIVTLFIGSILILRSFTLDLVHLIVMNAVIQKAPEEYPEERIRRSFEEARRRSEAADSREEYLEELLAISKRIEKIQRMEWRDLDELLSELTDGDAD